MYYINIFFIFSFLGHIIENFVYTKVDSGILYGRWTPIYGIGVLIIIFIYHQINKLKIHQIVKTILLFFTCAIALSTLETIGGYTIEFLFGRIFWSYQNHHYPIGKYTSLDMMLLWGIASVGFVYCFLPFMKDTIKKIPKVITHVLLILFLFDVLYTYFQLGRFSLFLR